MYISGSVMKRSFCAFTMVLAALMLLTSCGLSNGISKEEIFQLVNDNADVLESDCEKADFSRSLKIRGIQSAAQESAAVSFNCGGSGFGSETNYWGFYYAPDDKIADIYPGNFTPEGNGFVWNEPNGDNRLYLEKIRDRFYYFAAHY